MKTIAAVLLLLSSISTWGATTAVLNLKGVVAENLELEIVPETLATNLPLDQAVTNQKVGTVREKSNIKDGYKVSVSSQNGGKLVRSGDAANFVTYQLIYNGQVINLSSTPTVIYTNASRGQFLRDLNITYSRPAEDMAAGDYADTVTFSITPN